MALVRWDPWSELARIRREFDGLFAERPAALAGGAGDWMPAADVARDDDGITLTLDLPGLTRDDVTVELRDQRLVVTGERKHESEQRRGDVVTRERIFGSFARELALPAGVESDDVHASFANGELTIKVALPREPEAKQIEIETREHAQV